MKNDCEMMLLTFLSWLITQQMKCEEKMTSQPPLEIVTAAGTVTVLITLGLVSVTL